MSAALPLLLTQTKLSNLVIFYQQAYQFKSELIQSQINQKILGYFFFQYTVGSIANGLGFNLTIFRPLVLSNHLFNPAI